MLMRMAKDFLVGEIEVFGTSKVTYERSTSSALDLVLRVGREQGYGNVAVKRLAVRSCSAFQASRPLMADGESSG